MDVVPNPFELLTDPQAVWQALERSQDLQRLERRVYRPLDRPAPVNDAEPLGYKAHERRPAAH